MARPSKPPRLVERGGVWYIIDTKANYRNSTFTKDRAQAQKQLSEYLMLRTGTTAPDEPLVKDILEAYRRAQIDKRRDRARKQVLQRAQKDGLTSQQAEIAAQQAAESVTDLGNDEFLFRPIKKHLGDVRVSIINNQVARNYRDARRKDGKRTRTLGSVRDGTIKRELTVLKAALGWAWKEDRGAWFGNNNTMPDFEMPVTEDDPAPRWFTHDEVRKMLERCTEAHIRLYIILATQTGARKEAILTLKWSDVDFRTGIIDFGRVDHRKRRPRVRITKVLRPVLWAAWINKIEGCDHVVSFHGKPIDDIRTGFKNLMKKCGLRGTPHNLKHTYISWLVMSGRLSYDQIATLANTTVNTIKKHYAALHPDIAVEVEDAVDVQYGPEEFGLTESDVPQPRTDKSSSKPTRQELMDSDMVARNVH